MRKIAVLLPAAALLAMAAAPAFAADVIAGQVMSKDLSAGTVTLSSGQQFRLAAPEILHGVYPGQHVIVTINDNKTVGLAEDSSYFDRGDGAPTSF